MQSWPCTLPVFSFLPFSLRLFLALLILLMHSHTHMSIKKGVNLAGESSIELNKSTSCFVLNSWVQFRNSTLWNTVWREQALPVSDQHGHYYYCQEQHRTRKKKKKKKKTVSCSISTTRQQQHNAVSTVSHQQPWGFSFAQREQFGSVRSSLFGTNPQQQQQYYYQFKHNNNYNNSNTGTSHTPQLSGPSRWCSGWCDCCQQRQQWIGLFDWFVVFFFFFFPSTLCKCASAAFSFCVCVSRTCRSHYIHTL